MIGQQEDPVGGLPIANSGQLPLPSLITDLGPAASFAWEEFFSGQLRNRHTRLAYLRAVRRFLGWLEPQCIPLPKVTPGMVGQYFDQHPGSVPSKKLDLAALRAWFNALVNRHVVFLNPAATVRGERYSAMEGLTPEITTGQARSLLDSIDTTSLPGLRDKCIVSVLIFTAARARAVAGLRRKHLIHDGTQYVLRFGEKGGKQREIPVRHDLEQLLVQYLEAANIKDAPGDSPLFRTLAGKTESLTISGVSAIDICRLVKRRLKAAGLSARLSPHSFRVCTVTNLLSQGVALEDVQTLAGHSDPRTTRLYDRRQRKVTRNIVERISV
jgi:integrase/recombinase XerD